MISTFLFIGALVSSAFAANLLSSSDQTTIANLVNAARSEIKSSMPQMSVDSNLVNLADSWTNKCTLKPDRKLKWLYSEVSFSAQQQLSVNDVVNFWLSESDAVRQYQAYELQFAGNWTTLLWEKSTKLGCSLAACPSGNDTTYFFGCLVSPKGRFAGVLPFKNNCVPSNPVDCVAKGGCGEYYDGCKVVTCGPSCDSANNTNRGWTRSIPTNLQNTLFSQDDEDVNKRGNTVMSILPSNYYIQSANGLYRAWLKNDGNFVVVTKAGLTLWESKTSRGTRVTYQLYVQSDGNLVIYDTADWQYKWASNTNGRGSPNYRLTIQDDGNLVLYDRTSTPLWASGTVVRPTPQPTPVPTPDPVPVTPLTTQAVTTSAVTTRAPNSPVTTKAVTTSPITTKALTTQAPPQPKPITTKWLTTMALTTSPPTPAPSPTPTPTPSDAVDWRTKGYVSPIKNQRGCGSCWAFTSSEVIETQWAFNKGSLPSVSPEHILSCSGAGSCDGGWMDGVYTWTEDNSVVSETQFPYTATEQPGLCASQPATNIRGNSNNAVYRVQRDNAAAMEDFVRKYGSLSVGFRVEDAFYDYSSGVYTTQCDYSGANHAVQIVGFGTTGEGVKYWIVRNSWGTRWGNGGYFLMQRGVNLCEIERYPSSWIPA